MQDSTALQMGMPDFSFRVLASFYGIGRCKSTGMGLIPIDWTDIDAYCNRSSFDLSPWECEQLFFMSKCYVSQVNNTDKYNGNPYQREYTDEELMIAARLQREQSKI